MSHRVWFVWLAPLFCQARGYAQSGPQPPCGKNPVPAYPVLDDPAIVKGWKASEAGRDWRPPAFTGWTAAGFSTLVTIAARFRYASGAQVLRRHAGAISELAGMRSWAITHKQWQTLILNAWAQSGAQPGQRREDFNVENLSAFYRSMVGIPTSQEPTAAR